jgi:hypothetical protein
MLHLTPNFMQQKIREQLHALAEPNYQEFSQKLVPDARNILGVQLPNLRKMAQRIAKSDWESYLQTASEDSFEEITLQGLVIEYVPILIEKNCL